MHGLPMARDHSSLRIAAVLAGLLVAAVSPAQEVTLPLSQYDELRARAHPPETPPPEPPEPLAFEEVMLTVEVGARSARIIQDLTVALYGDGWQALELPRLGTFVAADFGELEGRLDTDGGWVLQLRGSGRQRVRLTTAVPVTADDSAHRPTRRLRLAAPAAALVRGVLRAGDGVEEVTVEGPMLLAGADAGGRRFTLAAGATAELTLLGATTAPERAALPLRFDATTAVALRVSRQRRKARGWLDLRVLQGQLEELPIELPAGYEVLRVVGKLAGWDVDGGRLTVTPLVPVHDGWQLELELAAGPAAELASPSLRVAGAAGGLAVSKVEVGGDGLLELLDSGAAMPPSRGEQTALPAAFRAAPGLALVQRAGAAAPRWQVSWTEGTEVLAAQVDRLLVDCLVGEAGRSYYRVWAEVRSRGVPRLEISLPAGAELVGLRRDGAPLLPGRSGGAWAVPLAAAAERQVIELSALLPLELPASGLLELPLPALSVPAGKVEVRAALPGGRRYTLVDAARAGRAGAPPRVAAAAEPPLLARQLGAVADGRGGAASLLEAPPPGFTVLEASWSALTPNPRPLQWKIVAETARKEWL